MTNRSRMSSIIGPVGLEPPELFALELGKNTDFDFVYTLASTKINQSATNFVKIYMTIRSWISSSMGLIGLKQHELFSLQLELLYFTWFALSYLCAYMMQA